MNLLQVTLLSFTVMLVAVLAMSVGVLAGRKPIKGSCGGLNGRGCELCSGRCPKRNTPEKKG